MGIFEFFVEFFLGALDFLLKFSAVTFVSFVSVMIVITDEAAKLKRVVLAIALEIGSIYFMFS